MFKLKTLNGEPLRGLYYLQNFTSLGSLTHQKKLKKVLGKGSQKEINHKGKLKLKENKNVD